MSSRKLNKIRLTFNWTIFLCLHLGLAYANYRVGSIIYKDYSTLKELFGFNVSDFSYEGFKLALEEYEMLQAYLLYTGIWVGIIIIHIIFNKILKKLMKKKESKEKIVQESDNENLTMKEVASSVQQVPVDAQPEVKYCVHCGEANDLDALFCTGCGLSFRKTHAKGEVRESGDTVLLNDYVNTTKEKESTLPVSGYENVEKHPNHVEAKPAITSDATVNFQNAVKQASLKRNDKTVLLQNGDESFEELSLKLEDEIKKLNQSSPSTIEKEQIGKKLAAVKFCTECGNKVPVTSVFCTECGKPMKKK